MASHLSAGVARGERLQYLVVLVVPAPLTLRLVLLVLLLLLLKTSAAAGVKCPKLKWKAQPESS